MQNVDKQLVKFIFILRMRLGSSRCFSLVLFRFSLCIKKNPAYISQIAGNIQISFSNFTPFFIYTVKIVQNSDLLSTIIYELCKTQLLSTRYKLLFRCALHDTAEIKTGERESSWLKVQYIERVFLEYLSTKY